MKAWAGWRPALRIAWRDAVRSRGRSALVLFMIALPVLGVTAAAVVARTADVEGVEGADRVMGAADALVRVVGDEPLVQAPDPDRQGWTPYDPAELPPDVEPLPGVPLDGATGGELDEASVAALLGDDARLVPITQDFGESRVDDRIVAYEVTGVDLHDPLAAPLFDLERGRLPAAGDEVVVNGVMLDKGFALGDELALGDTTATIVGVGRHASARDYPVVMGPVGALESGHDSEWGAAWLVEAGDVSWEEVLDLNARGALVTSRAVLADPPDLAAIEARLGWELGSAQTSAVVVLIAVMALIEVVLLAGPAFAVGARRHARSLALIAASGGTPAQARRVVLAGGLVLGSVAAVGGVFVGIALGWAVLPLVQLADGAWFGPFDVPWSWLAAIAAFGLLSAFLAAVVPAWIASRQDVVAVLSGRRGDRRPRASTPVLGLLLLAAGTAGSAYAAVRAEGDATAVWMGVSAVVSVLGMILVVPVVVSLVARLARRLPLSTRYAARDAARHRTRTVPAVAAVAATVAGVVALGIAATSEELANEETYSARLPDGVGSVSWWPQVLEGEEPPPAEPTWREIEEAVGRAAPEVGTAAVLGVEESSGDTYTYLDEPGRDPESEPLLWSYGAGYGSSLLVAERPADLSHLLPADLVDEAAAGVARGDVVVLTSRPVEAREVVVWAETWNEEDETSRRERVARVPATYLDVGAESAPAQAVLPAAVAEGAGLDVVTIGLALVDPVDGETEERIAETVAGAVSDTSVYVERGYQRSSDALIALIVLGALGGVLMIGGTLTATFLALSDARPDFATLSAVGAAPRTRRRVAASYAVVVGLVGAVLGAAVGFIPGVAISRPLTTSTGWNEPSGPYLDVPWLLVLTVVLALPLLTAGIVWLTARSRLPLATRLQ